jgi:peptide/nickel transport system substrate-binding protein
MEPGPAEGRVREMLEPFAADLLPGALEGYALPVATGRSATAPTSRAPWR